MEMIKGAFCNSNVVDWILAGTTLAAVLVAIFQEHIKRVFWKPKIELVINQTPPDCQKIVVNKYSKEGLIQATALSYYFRLRVKNSGSSMAEHVEIQAIKLSKFNGKSFKIIDNFSPMNFVFSHTKERFLESLSPNMEKLCDLFHIIDPSQNQSFIPFTCKAPVIWFDLEVTPTDYGNLVSEDGLYKLDIIVGASNITKSIMRSIFIEFSGKWNDDEYKMIGEEVALKICD